MSLIDYQDSRPIYEQIASYYERLILSGVMKPDEQMPSVRSLAMELSTNPNTVQKAYSDLESRGFLYSVKGLGNYVRENPKLRDVKKEELVDRMVEIHKDADEFGFDMQELLNLTDERRGKNSQTQIINLDSSDEAEKKEGINTEVDNGRTDA